MQHFVGDFIDALAAGQKEFVHPRANAGPAWQMANSPHAIQDSSHWPRICAAIGFAPPIERVQEGSGAEIALLSQAGRATVCNCAQTIRHWLVRLPRQLHDLIAQRRKAIDHAGNIVLAQRGFSAQQAMQDNADCQHIPLRQVTCIDESWWR